MAKYLLFFIPLFFLSHNNYSQTDEIKQLLVETKNIDLDMWDLSDYVSERLNSEEKLSNFFYHWIGQNVSYDYIGLEKTKNGDIEDLRIQHTLQKPKEVFENRKAICSGYANLYQWFMDDLGIESEIIIGHIRDKRNHYVDLNNMDFSHAWNAVKIDGRWRLVDTTWGNSNDPNQAEYYYDINPKWLIATHYPLEAKWQLLDEPLDLDSFNRSIFVSPIWYHLGFEEIPQLKADANYYYLIFKDIETDWQVNLTHSSDNIEFKYLIGMETFKQDGINIYRFEKSQIAEQAFFKIELTSSIETESGFYIRKHPDVINFKN